MSAPEGNMKRRVASTLKWNVIDKISTQLLYAITGIILARVLNEDDFGLIGAILVFQSFATLFVDSGFSYALLQRKRPTDDDYSSVLWFNLAVATLLYVILFFSAPFIADLFQGDERLIPLSRVMFITFIINASAIVQTNRRMKSMNVKMVTVSNSLGLFAGAVVGIFMALTDYGAWALVWQAVAVSTVKSATLWCTDSWRPTMKFSLRILKSFFKVGSGVIGTSFLNVVFQNIYSFFIGNRVGMAPLGYYTQADKWSKMGVASLAAIFTQSFLPLLSEFQDNPEKYAATTSKINRFASYLVFPAFTLLAVLATPIFHALFGEKWDPSIILFQLLLLRGVFTILVTLYHNYVLSLGKSRLMVYSEIIRDGTALVAIFITLPYIALSSPENVTEGIAIFLWGQVVASVVAWAAMLVIAAKVSWSSPLTYILDSLPYALQSLIIGTAVAYFLPFIDNPWIQTAVFGTGGIIVYIAINYFLGSRIQKEVMNHLLHR